MNQPEFPTQEYYERLAAQDHPDVLPSCVETLSDAQRKVMDNLIQVDAYHEQEKSQGKRRLGIAALAGTIAVTQTEAADVIFNMGPGSKPVAVAGVLVVGAVGVWEGLKGLRRRHVSESLIQEHFVLTIYHHVARSKAEKMGLMKSEGS